MEKESTTCDEMTEGTSIQPPTDMHHVSIEEHDQSQTEFKHEEQHFDTLAGGGVDEPLESESVSGELLLPKEEVIDPLEEESEESERHGTEDDALHVEAGVSCSEEGQWQ